MSNSEEIVRINQAIITIEKHVRLFDIEDIVEDLENKRDALMKQEQDARKIAQTMFQKLNPGVFDVPDEWIELALEGLQQT